MYTKGIGIKLQMKELKMISNYQLTIHRIERDINCKEDLKLLTNIYFVVCMFLFEVFTSV